MHVPKEAMLLRIFFGDEDRFEGKPLYEAIVLKAREMHLAGATVLRGPMGYGHSSRLHTAKVLRLSFDLPMVVEIVDTEAKINELLPVLDTMMASGLITMEKVQVLHTAPRASKSEPAWPKGCARRTCAPATCKTLHEGKLLAADAPPRLRGAPEIRTLR